MRGPSYSPVINALSKACKSLFTASGDYEMYMLKNGNLSPTKVL